MKQKLALFVAVVMFFPLSSIASENIRVVIADNQKAVTLTTSASLIVAGNSSGAREKKMTFSAASVGGRPVRVRSTGEFTGVNGKSYRGWVELRKKKNGLLLVINDLEIEDYLRGVIAAEIPPEWEFEALKAQAVAARTYALYQKRMAENRPYHILATVSSQVYNGGNGERSNAVKAGRATKGIVIVYQGEVIPAFYHSSCGGHTESALEIWGINAPYLKGVDCECQEIIKDGLWEKRMSMPQVVGALRRQGYKVKDISDMSIVSITPAGRVKEVSMRSGGKTSVFPGEILRAAIGNTVLPSVFFELDVVDGEAVFSGRGRGHGVGLCQWGAKEMAERGYDYKSILSHYYPGTTLTLME